MFDLKKIANSSKAACRVVTKKNGVGSGVLVDGSSLGFPHACLLTNEHVIGTKEQAASATIIFNYEDTVHTKWLQVKLDPDYCFNKDKDLDVCLVALKTASIPRLSQDTAR